MTIQNLTSDNYFLGRFDVFLESGAAITFDDSVYTGDSRVSNAVDGLFTQGKIVVSDTTAAIITGEDNDFFE